MDKEEWMKSWASQTEREEKKILRDQEKREYLYRGFINGILWCARHFVTKHREDIAAVLLKESDITMEKCNEIKAGLLDKKLVERILGKESRRKNKNDYDYSYR
jgi:hypothetical protein